MKDVRFRAVVLAAGFGVRLRPLTLSVPKPLLPVAGVPVLGRTLAALKRAGCEQVAINLHYLGDKIAAHFGTDFEGMPLQYSPEDPIRGTFGALTPLRDFLGRAELSVVINGDSLARWPLEALIRRHREKRPRATLLVSRRADPARFGGGVGVTKDGRIVALRHPYNGDDVDNRRVFAGAHVFSPESLGALPVEPADFVADHYQPMLERGEEIRAFETSAPWFDLGKPARYLEAVRKWVGSGVLHPRGWWDSTAEVSPEASVRRSVLESGVKIEAGARLRRALVLSGATVGEGSAIRESILGFGVQLPAGTVIESRLVTKARADVPLDSKSSSVGGFVYSPLE